MIKLSAYQTTIILPDPEWNNSSNLLSNISIKRSMNGAKYTYVKSKSRQKLLLTFTLTEEKCQEVKKFIQRYLASPITLIDHNEDKWIGTIINNPFEATSKLSDIQNISLEFEGIKQ